MRKLADFIVDKRYIILILFIILTGFCMYLNTKVNINYDITEYLPKSSETRIGMDIMNNQFEEEKSSNLLVMFHNISGHEEEILNELSRIKGVNSVEYDNTKDYNKDGYTLYNLNVKDYSKSKTSKYVYDTVLEKYQNQKVKLSGSINDEYKPVVETWIIITSICSAMIILIIMCDSYVEPFLFLFTIGLAVFINKGTNIMFSSVSNITDSICAVLQMALSMDYSIMLMNRYTQEKNNTRDNKEAMKNALHNSFASISSSSVTTIVGLIALVFMSFTIGKDLGYVLAKGVLLSLVCIFAVLPCLILMFDNLITKTKKKHLNIRLDKLGRFVHDYRYGALALIVLLFIVSFSLKGNLKILYTDTEDDAVAGVFKESNQMAIIYNNKDEDKMAEICRKINTEKVDQVLCYGNTINEKLTYKGLTAKLEDLNVETDVEDYLLKLVYYNYYAKNKTNEMTSLELINFIENNIYNNKDLSKHVDYDTRLNINKLKYFAIPSEVGKERSSNELADILGIDKESIDNLLLVYHSNKTTTTMSINEFVNYVYSDVVNNKLFTPYITNDMLESLNTLNKMIDINNIYTKYDSNTMASIFGLDNDSMSKLYLYYYSIYGVDTTLTINELTTFILNDVVTNPEYSSMFDEETINNINLLNTYSDTSITNKEMNSTELSNLLGIEEDKVKLLQILVNIDKGSNSTYTLKDMENISKDSINDLIQKIKDNPELISNITEEDINNVLEIIDNYSTDNNIDLNKLSDDLIEYLGIDKNNTYTVQEIIDIINVKLQEEYNNKADIIATLVTYYNNDIPLTSNDLSSILGMDKKYVDAVYTLMDYEIVGLTTSPKDTINYIVNNQDNTLISTYLDEESLNKINKVNTIINNSDNSIDYNTLSNLIGFDTDTIKKLYSLHDSYNNTLLLDKKTLITFILNHQYDKELSSINADTINKLNTLNNVLDGIINNRVYNYNEMSNLLGIDNKNMRLLYSNYDIKRGINVSVSLKQLTDFILTDIVTDSRFNSSFDWDKTTKVQAINTFMNNTINNNKYTSTSLYNSLSPISDTKLDYNMFDLVYLYYGSVYDYNDRYKLTIEEFINYLNNDILKDDRFTDFIDKNRRKEIIDSKKEIDKSKKLLVGKDYSRIVINTKYGMEDDDTMGFIKDIKKDLKTTKNDNYIIGDSPMAYGLNQTFGNEFNFISILTMIFIFTVVAVTFKSGVIPLILTLIIQCAVYITMGILSIFGGSVYFIALLIVQSILMGATIDYAIVYTSYYIEYRGTYNKKGALIKAYNQSIHTILTSASVLTIVTFIVGFFATAIAAKICMTISQGTLCSTILVLFILPGVLASFDKFIVKKD
ncbi:MAG: MMPL family transporter [Bacilli bacterium]|nr:MMPL family transporter [Bacilli bacterium]